MALPWIQVSFEYCVGIRIPYFRSTNFRGYLLSPVKANRFSRVLIFANWSYFELLREAIFAFANL